MEPVDPSNTALEAIFDRLSAVERRIDAIERAMAMTPAAVSTAPPPPTTTLPPPPKPHASPPPRPPVRTDVVTGPRALSNRPEFNLEFILRWAGVALTVLAAVFFVASAIDRGWLTPELQLIGAAMAGFALLAAALVIGDTRRPWARALAIGGAATIVICAGAGYSWLNLWDPATALALVAIATALSVVVAWRLDMESVALTAVFAALLVPVWASILSDAPVVVAGVWLAALAIAGSVVGLDRLWPVFRLSSVWAIATGTTTLGGLLYLDDNADHVVSGILLVAVVAATLWLPAGRTANAARSDVSGMVGDRSWIRALELRSAVLVPSWTWYSLLLFAGLIADGDQGTRIETSGGITGLALAGGFGGMAMSFGWRDGRRTGSTIAVSHLLGAGLLATVVIVAWFGGPVMTVALAAQGLATVVLARRLDQPTVCSESGGWNLLYLQGLAISGLASVILMSGLADQLVLGDFPSRVTDGLAYGMTVAALLGLALVVDRDHGFRAAPAWLVAWAAGAVFSIWLVDPEVEPILGSNRWLVTGTVVALAGLGLSRRIGLWVLVQSGLLLAATLTASGFAISSSIVGDPTWTDHLSTAVVLVGGWLVAALLWRRARSGSVANDPSGPGDAAAERLTNAVGRAAALHRSGGDPDPARLLTAAVWLLSLGWIAAFFLDRFDGSAGQAAVSLAWAVAACAAIVASVIGRHPVGPGGDFIIRSIGVGTLFLVLGKLLTVDLAAIDALWRVGLFLAVGVALLRLGYALPRLAQRFGMQ